MAEKIHYLIVRDQGAASAAEVRLGRYGSVRIDADADDAGPYQLVILNTMVVTSPEDDELEALAQALGGEYDGSEAEIDV